MEYTEDILARVRAALIEYHAATAADGRKRSWLKIATDLHYSFLEPPPIDDDEDDDEDRIIDIDKPVAESLRRFASGAQVPAKERLDAICAFLQEKSYLTVEDLIPAEPGSPLIRALQSFFGPPDDPATTRRYFARRGAFVARRKKEVGPAQLSIISIRDSASGAVMVEDMLYTLPVAPQSFEPAALNRHLRKTGGARQRWQGWLFQSGGQVCLFVQDSLGEGASVYTIIRHKAGEAAAPGFFELIKSRDFGAPPTGYESHGLRLMEGRAPEEVRLARLQENIWSYTPQDGPHGP